MMTVRLAPLLLVLAAMLLAGCAPVAGPLAAGASGPGASIITSSSSTPRYRFEAGAFAQPQPAGQGLFRVGAIDVFRDDVQLQSIDVIMDQPDGEWATLPLRSDDINFDGEPDLVVFQPAGAKWGHLHTWVYDAGKKQFVTNTLTSELGQLVVGDYRLDPDAKTIEITNAAGMTPFSAFYRTTGGYLMPAFPPAAASGTGSCPGETSDVLLREERHGYCFGYPDGFEPQRPNEDEIVIGLPGSMGHGPMAFIAVNVTGEKTVEQIADELVAPFDRLTPTPGHEDAFRIRRSSGTLAGEPAVILDGMPGQDLGRVVLVGHRGHLYTLTFVPADRGNESYTQMDWLFSTITGSWRFLAG